MFLRRCYVRLGGRKKHLELGASSYPWQRELALKLSKHCGKDLVKIGLNFVSKANRAA
jgi:hypothetical protein